MEANNEKTCQSEIEKRIEEALEISGKEASDELPYEFKYQAKEKFEKLITELLPSNDKVLIGRLCYYLGVICYDTDEPSIAEKLFIKAVNELGDYSKGINLTEIQEEENSFSIDKLNDIDLSIKNDTSICLDMNASIYFCESYNYLGMIWCNRGDYEKSCTFLKKAEDIHSQFQSTANEDVKEKHKKAMEKCFTMTAFYLAQVYAIMKDVVSSSKYCFFTLKRQLEGGIEFDKYEWVENCLQLSAYFLQSDINDFGTAFYFIKASEFIFNQNSSSLLERDGGKDLKYKIEIAKGKYFLTKLNYCKDWVEKNEPNRIIESHILKAVDDQVVVPIVPLIDSSQFHFDYPGLESNSDVQTVARNFKDALVIFKEGKKAFEMSLNHFVLEGYVTDHVSILQDLSQAYRSLIFFEPDLDRKIAMEERRLELIQELVNELNVIHYRFTLKQLTFEVGEIYVTVLELLLLKSKFKENYKEPTVKRLNTVITNSIKYLIKFSELFKERGAVNVEPENNVVYIRSHLLLARMYYNYISSDPTTTIEYLKKSLIEYEYSVKFHKQLDENIGIEGEIDMAKQMCSLLPIKIDEINRLLHM
ncbi:hypothetical protein ABK040_007117 [Willaertia magna]